MNWKQITLSTFKIVSYQHISSLVIAEESQLKTSKQWGLCTGESKETKEEPAVIRLEEEMKEDCFKQKFIGKKQRKSISH